MALKAKLADKGRLRPHEMIRKKMPDGTGSLQDLPMRAHGAAAEDEAADGEYCKAIDRVTAVFGKQNRAQTTADEHKRIPMYVKLKRGMCSVCRKGPESEGYSRRGRPSPSACVQSTAKQ